MKFRVTTFILRNPSPGFLNSFRALLCMFLPFVMWCVIVGVSQYHCGVFTLQCETPRGYCCCDLVLKKYNDDLTLLWKCWCFLWGGRSMTDGVFGSVVLKTEPLANQMLSRLLVTKCLKTQFKRASLIGRLLSVNTTLVHVGGVSPLLCSITVEGRGQKNCFTCFALAFY